MVSTDICKELLADNIIFKLTAFFFTSAGTHECDSLLASFFQTRTDIFLNIYMLMFSIKISKVSVSDE